jgi:hypothetical protein
MCRKYNEFTADIDSFSTFFPKKIVFHEIFRLDTSIQILFGIIKKVKVV